MSPPKLRGHSATFDKNIATKYKADTNEISVTKFFYKTLVVNAIPVIFVFAKSSLCHYMENAK